MRPSPEEVLRSISYTFDALIRPDPASPLAISYGLTVSNMLRQLQLSLKHEERLIVEDTTELRHTLDLALAWLRENDPEEDAGTAIDLAMDLPVDPREPARSRRENWRQLRGSLEVSIKRMQALRDVHGTEEAYRMTREALRDYLDRSLEREKMLIDGAFTLARR